MSDKAVGNARNWLKSITDMPVKPDSENELEGHKENWERQLSISVRGAWHRPDAPETLVAYQLLLAKDGSMSRIIGDLNDACEPETARLEWQDFGTPWTLYQVNANEQEALLRFARQFYYGPYVVGGPLLAKETEKMSKRKSTLTDNQIDPDTAHLIAEDLPDGAYFALMEELTGSDDFVMDLGDDLLGE